MGHIAQDIPTEAKIPVVSPGTACQPATIPHTTGRTVAGELLELPMDVYFFHLCRCLGKLFFQFFALPRVLRDQLPALFLALNH